MLAVENASRNMPDTDDDDDDDEIKVRFRKSAN